MNALTLQALNGADEARFVSLLDGIYEHSPWIAAQAWARRPAAGFTSLAALKRALVEVVREADPATQRKLLCAHPALAGKAMVDGRLTAASGDEQSRAGLTHCTAAEFNRLQQLNADYEARFGFPFILAVRGPRGQGLTRAQIITIFEPALGNQVWDWAEALAVHSDVAGALTVTYLTEAHRACARQLVQWMRDECGFDSVDIDAVGNVVVVYQGHDAAAPRLLTGSHYDTVRNGGKYDGRLGILVPMACVRELARAGRRLPFGIEVVGFAEEEGQRYKATFLGSGALTGNFDPAWLDQRDADGVAMRDAMAQAGLDPAAVPALRRDPARYLGFVEVHIEQGPVLAELDLPLGVVTSINGGLRYLGEVTGMASHAGTTPMGRRRDAAAAVAELVLYVEQRAASVADVVGTVGLLQVPDGSINVVPGRCRFSLDLRATDDAARDALAADVRAELVRICERRGLAYTLEETMRAAAAPSDAPMQARWAAAVQALGLPVHAMPSGAGHDAMKLHTVMPQAMLFQRGLNAGISHNPLEAVTNDDSDLCVRAFQALLEHLAEKAT